MAVRTEESIKKDVVNRLFWDGRVDASDVNVDVDAGTVTLRGSVPSSLARDAAVTDARNTAGVTGVVNQIGLEPRPTIQVPSEAEIEENVTSVLRWTSDIDMSDIEISVAAGRVGLRGSVDAYWKKHHAEDLVAGIVGVVEVDNELTVVPTKDVLDQTISEDIVAELERSTLVDVEDITIRVEKGAVTLSGTVPTWSARQAAYDAALFTAGVTNIHDNIVVAP